MFKQQSKGRKIQLKRKHFVQIVAKMCFRHSKAGTLLCCSKKRVGLMDKVKALYLFTPLLTVRL